MSSEFDVKSAKDQALAELTKERQENAKLKIKAKLKELEAAELVVKNVKRELEDLEHELSHGL